MSCWRRAPGALQAERARPARVAVGTVRRDRRSLVRARAHRCRRGVRCRVVAGRPVSATVQLVGQLLGQLVAHLRSHVVAADGAGWAQLVPAAVVLLDPHSEASPPHLASLEAGVVGCQGSGGAGPRSGVALMGGRGCFMVGSGGVVGGNTSGPTRPCNGATAGVGTPTVAVDLSSPGRLLDIRCRA